MTTSHSFQWKDYASLAPLTSNPSGLPILEPSPFTKKLTHLSGRDDWRSEGQAVRNPSTVRSGRLSLLCETSLTRSPPPYAATQTSFLRWRASQQLSTWNMRHES
ncbi:hypothetical protein SUGI_0550220 [Cryptomeria japonica]|nr:hypothetical protein SUGI_0550220 [Cryptomeria japonica]